jgi:hypothetical protein
MTDNLSILVDLCNDIQQRSNLPSVDPHANCTESLVYITEIPHDPSVLIVNNSHLRPNSIADALEYNTSHQTEASPGK